MKEKWHGAYRANFGVNFSVNFSVHFSVNFSKRASSHTPLITSIAALYHQLHHRFDEYPSPDVSVIVCLSCYLGTPRGDAAHSHDDCRASGSRLFSFRSSQHPHALSLARAILQAQDSNDLNGFGRDFEEIMGHSAAYSRYTRTSSGSVPFPSLTPRFHRSPCHMTFRYHISNKIGSTANQSTSVEHHDG
jgi:hypothetical protein